MIEELTLRIPTGNQTHTLVAEYHEMHSYNNTLEHLSIYAADDLSEEDAANYVERGKSSSIWMLIDFEIKATEV